MDIEVQPRNLERTWVGYRGPGRSYVDTTSDAGFIQLQSRAVADRAWCLRSSGSLHAGRFSPPSRSISLDSTPAVSSLLHWINTSDLPRSSSSSSSVSRDRGRGAGFHRSGTVPDLRPTASSPDWEQQYQQDRCNPVPRDRCDGSGFHRLHTSCTTTSNTTTSGSSSSSSSSPDCEKRQDRCNRIPRHRGNGAGFHSSSNDPDLRRSARTPPTTSLDREKHQDPRLPERAATVPVSSTPSPPTPGRTYAAPAAAARAHPRIPTNRTARRNGAVRGSFTRHRRRRRDRYLLDTLRDELTCAVNELLRAGSAYFAELTRM
ncbi:uncharacterized protein LOC127533318 [Acanthochromis polyacanthus]|uniref:uncharacterized protein LOC127533318 n=1 Tax=Acanthochromis polyacanthus TaxID=80966 RepID=UPI002233FE49|nr:uncharacterized protein LOC127533318 [Acanthochromis polyacanthus]